MPKQKSNSRVLRELAEEFIGQICEEDGIFESEREDLVTSLVRQWVTYEGNATLFIEGQQFQLLLGSTPLGKLRVTHSPVQTDWSISLERDWNIAPEELPDIYAQLNRGQSVELTNRDGMALRLWVDPQKKKSGVEELVPKPAPAGHIRDDFKIAMHHLVLEFGDELDGDEMSKLASSVVRQWRRFDGHAALFLDHQRIVSFILTESDNGGCKTRVKHRASKIEPFLLSLGITPDMLPEVIAHLNLGEDIELRGPQDGTKRVLMHNPKEGRLFVRGGPAVSHHWGVAAPDCCPQCNAVLSVWEPSMQRQSCPVCGFDVARP